MFPIVTCLQASPVLYFLYILGRSRLDSSGRSADAMAGAG